MNREVLLKLEEAAVLPHALRLNGCLRRSHRRISGMQLSAIFTASPGDYELAQDLAQDTFVQAYKSILKNRFRTSAKSMALQNSDKQRLSTCPP